MKFNLKSLLPHLIALGIFLIISISYFHPALFGYVVKMHDIETYQGMSKEVADFKEATGEEALWTNSMFGGMPATQISITYNNWMSYAYSIITLGLPRPISMLWMYMLGFYILLLSLKVDFRLAIVVSLAFAFSTYFFVIIQAGHMSKANAISLMAPTLAGIILAYRGRLLLGASLFALFLGLELSANHLQITYYFVFIVLFVVLGELIYFIKSKKISEFVKISAVILLFSVLSVVTNIGNLWGTIEYGKESTRGKSELTNTTGVKTKGLDRDYATAWSYGKEETFSLMFPYVKGGGNLPLFMLHEDAVSEENLEKIGERLNPQVKQQVFNQVVNETSYWGNQSFTSGNDYIGIIIVFLAFLTFFFVKGALKWTLLAVTLLAIFLAWGKNMMWLTNLFLDHMPGYNKFRTVSMILIIAELTVPILAALFLKELATRKNEIENKINTFYIAGGVFLLFVFLLGLLPETFFSFFPDGQGKLTLEYLQQNQPDMTPDQQMGVLAFYNNEYYPFLKDVRVSIFRGDVWKGFFILVLTVALILGYLKSKLNLIVLSIGLGILILSDMWTVNSGYINSKDYEDSRFWQSKEDGSLPYAVFSGDETIFQQETQGKPEILKEIDNKIKKAQDKRIDGLSKREIDAIRFGTLNLNSNFRVFTVSNPFNESRTSYFYKSIGGYHGAKLKRYQEVIDSCLSRNNQKVLDMLNTKYIVQYQQDSKTREQNNTLAQLRPSALGNAWFVDNVKIVEDANEEIKMLKEENGFNPAKTAIVDKRFSSLINDVNPKDSSASIVMTGYKPNYLTYSFKSSTPQITIFSEIFYQSGWQAFIDEKPVDHFRANYILRGLEIPKGEHKIEFKYSVNSFTASNILSPIGFLIIIGLFLFFIYKEYKKEESL